MNSEIKFALYRHHQTYYIDQNGQQETLHTKNRTEATRLCDALNATGCLAGYDLQVAYADVVVSSSRVLDRTWQEAVDFIIARETTRSTRHRWQRFSKDQALASLWKLRVVETPAHQLLTRLKKGTASTNMYLRRLHDFAFDMNWLPWPILTGKLWPRVEHGKKPAARLDPSFERILSGASTGIDLPPHELGN